MTRFPKTVINGSPLIVYVLFAAMAHGVASGSPVLQTVGTPTTNSWGLPSMIFAFNRSIASGQSLDSISIQTVRFGASSGTLNLFFNLSESGGTPYDSLVASSPYLAPASASDQWASVTEYVTFSLLGLTVASSGPDRNCITFGMAAGGSFVGRIEWMTGGGSDIQYVGPWSQGVSVAVLNNGFFSLNATSSAVPEIDPAGMGAVLALVTGALGLVERRRLRAFA